MRQLGAHSKLYHILSDAAPGSTRYCNWFTHPHLSNFQTSQLPCWNRPAGRSETRVRPFATAVQTAERYLRSENTQLPGDKTKRKSHPTIARSLAMLVLSLHKQLLLGNSSTDCHYDRNWTTWAKKITRMISTFRPNLVWHFFEFISYPIDHYSL